MPEDLLVTYLSDHLAGAETAIALIERWKPHVKDTDLARFFDELETDIRTDMDALDAIKSQLAPGSGGAKRAAGWLAEKLLRLKLSRASGVRERFALFESLEVLALGILGKRALWALLGELRSRHHHLDGHDFGVLELRAVDQAQRVEAARLALGRELFSQNLGSP